MEATQISTENIDRIPAMEVNLVMYQRTRKERSDLNILAVNDPIVYNRTRRIEREQMTHDNSLSEGTVSCTKGTKTQHTDGTQQNEQEKLDKTQLDLKFLKAEYI